MKPLPVKVSGRDDYLSRVSPKDEAWNKHKSDAEQVEILYQGTDFQRYADRMRFCSGVLEFAWVLDPQTEEKRLKLAACRFCRCRHCCICQWRRSKMHRARFLKVLPAIVTDYPTARYLFLTLTVKNCPLEELRDTLKAMNKSWERLTHRKDWPGIGFARSTEVTRGKDGTAHPHFHALIMVPGSYFQGAYYLSQAKWTQLWQDCARLPYTPVVDVRAVKPNRKPLEEGSGGLQVDLGVAGAVVETFKYTVKPADLLTSPDEEENRAWLVELTTQMHRVRALALGGVFKKYLSEDDPEDLIGEDSGIEVMDGKLFFGWQKKYKQYVRIDG